MTYIHDPWHKWQHTYGVRIHGRMMRQMIRVTALLLITHKNKDKVTAEPTRPPSTFQIRQSQTQNCVVSALYVSCSLPFAINTSSLISLSLPLNTFQFPLKKKIFSFSLKKKKEKTVSRIRVKNEQSNRLSLALSVLLHLYVYIVKSIVFVIICLWNCSNCLGCRNR